MDSIRKPDSSLSISSIISDSSPINDESELTAKSHSMLKFILEAVSDTNAENSALGNEILELFNVLKFDIKSLPADIKEGNQKITAILKSEGLPCINEMALKLSLEKRKMQNKMKEQEEKLLKAEYNTAFAKYNTLQEKLNKIRKEIDQIEYTLQLKIYNDEDAESDRIFFSSKLHDYKGTIKQLEKELDSLQSQEIALDNTLQKSSLLMNKLNDLTQLNTVLEQYGDLPPNLLQAKSVLECKKQELEEIENLIQDKMNN